MVKSCVGLETSAANFWMSLMAVVRGSRPLDVTKHAKLCLRGTLDEIDEAEQELAAELARLVQRVQAVRQAGAGRIDSARLRPLLMQCRKVRAKTATLAKKRVALESHMDTLDNSELNQHVLHSMQKTSHALKGMGLDKALESVDRVMSDIEENHADATSIQTSLAAAYDCGEDFDIEAEMALLLDAEDYAYSAAPEERAHRAPTALLPQTSGPTAPNTMLDGAPALEHAVRELEVAAGPPRAALVDAAL